MISKAPGDRFLCIFNHGSRSKRFFNTIIWACERFEKLDVLLSDTSEYNNSSLSGGHVGMVFGWFIPCCFVMFVALSMAEMASSMP